MGRLLSERVVKACVGIAASVVTSVVVVGCSSTVSGMATATGGATGFVRAPVTFDPCVDYPQEVLDRLGLVKSDYNGDQGRDNRVYDDPGGGQEMHIGCGFTSAKYSMTLWAENVSLQETRDSTTNDSHWDTTINGRNAVMFIQNTFGNCSISVEVPGGVMTILFSEKSNKPSAGTCDAVVHFATVLEPYYPDHI